VVVDAAVKETTKTTLRSGWRGVVKNDLTGPTLLEISDYHEKSFAASSAGEIALAAKGSAS